MERAASRRWQAARRPGAVASGPSIAAGGGRLDMAPAAYGQTPCGEGASLVTTWCHRDAAWPSASDADTAALA